MNRGMNLTLGTKIELLRGFRNMIQKELAARIDVDPSNLSEYENDKTIPSLPILKKIALVCRMHPAYFFDDVLPNRYDQLITDLEYSFYLGSLPKETAQNLRFALRSMYEFNLLKDTNPLRQLVEDASNESVQSVNMEKYLLLLKKKGINAN